MDPITHAVFGIGLAGFSNTLFSPYNPIYAAAITGAVAPDLDVITHLGGRLSFLKHHRGFSHSLPGLILSAALISIIISIDYPGTSLP
ncbi:MAG: metal-dependent hydrolase, partial [Firmicutes bacterium]|nr:metal-dependent hydrolase [Bacillota bacterium]